MKRLITALLMLALCLTLAHAESDPRIILYTVYQQRARRRGCCSSSGLKPRAWTKG